MRYKLAADTEYQNMSQHNGGEMYQLISKISMNYGSSSSAARTKTTTTTTTTITRAPLSNMSDGESDVDGDTDQPPPPPQKHLTLVEVDTLCRQALSTSGLNAVATKAITTVVTAAERDGCHSHMVYFVSRDMVVSMGSSTPQYLIWHRGW